MWLFSRFIARRLAGERLRSAVTALGVALGVAVVVAIRLANVSSVRGFEQALETMAGATSLEIVGSAEGFDERRLVALTWLGELGRLSPVIEGEAMYAPRGIAGSASEGDDRAAIEGGRRRASAGEMLRVVGIDILRDRPFREYALRSSGGEGEGPSAREFLDLLRDPRAIILTAKFAGRHGLSNGGRVDLAIGDRVEVFTVAGLLDDVGPARALDGGIALMDIAAAQVAFGKLGRLDRLDVRLDEPEQLDAAEQLIASRLPEGLTVQRPSRRGRQVEQMLAAFHHNLAALSYIALIVGLFMVYNTVATSVVARRSEIGTLRALGVSRGRVLRLFLGEALVLALPASVVGVLLGRVLAVGAVALTSGTVSTLYVATGSAPPTLDWTHWVLGLLVGVPLSLAAAAQPALEASRVSPTAALRGADRLETRFRLRRRFLVAPLALAALGAWLATRPASGTVPIGGYAAAVVFVFAAAFLVPAVLFAMARAGRRALGFRRGSPVPGSPAPAHRFFFVEGWLANASLSGAIPRLSISIAALAVSLAMMAAIAIMIGSFRETVVYWVGQTLTADLFVGPSSRSGGARQATISEEVERRIAAHEAVEVIDRVRQIPVPYGDSQAYLLAGDFTSLVARGQQLFKDPRDGKAAIRATLGEDVVVVSEAFSIRHGRGVGDDISLATPSGRARFRIVAVYFDYSSDRGVIAIDRAVFARHFGEARPTGLNVYLREGADAMAVRRALLDTLGASHRVFIYTNAGLRGEVLRIFDRTFAITYALELIAVVVAILGVAATLLTLILEREHEFAVLRLVGADRRQVRRMVVWEALMMGAVSQSVGLVVGVVLSLVLIYVINVQSFGWTIQFHMPWWFLTQMTLVILTATALAGLYPARLAARRAAPIREE